MNKTYGAQALTLLALGYFVDFFDLTLFAATRAQILQSFQIDSDNLFNISRLIFNSQAIGIMLGGLIAGIWGDKIGRLSSVRFGIFLYSTAILFSVFTTSIHCFIFLRFIAGVGLAGELASSITVTTEILEGKARDIAANIIYFFGIIGGISATILSNFVHWKTLFLIGGCAGFALLFFRMSIREPVIFNNVKKNPDISRGSLKLLLFKKESFIRVLGLISLLVPFWFMVYFINFGPEIAKHIGLRTHPNQSIILVCFFVGSILGTYLFTFLAQALNSRKKTIFCTFAIMLFAIMGLLIGGFLHLWQFYALMLLIGLSCGYPGVFTVLAAESFGTNQRTTGTCVVSCVGRGSAILVNLFVPWMMNLFHTAALGIMWSNILIFILGITALTILQETHQRSIDFVEQH